MGLALIALSVLAYATFSRRLDGSIVTAPMVFSAVGLILGPAAFGFVELDPESPAIDWLAEATLVLVLFADASRMDLRALKGGVAVPVRLLAIGLPLTLALGASLAVLLFPNFSLWEAALLGAILAPTDAALGQAVVSDRRVPVRIRQALNVESGLNDGICLPFVAMFIALAAGVGPQGASHWAAYAAQQLLLGPAVGIAVGYAGGRLVTAAMERQWMSKSFEQLSALALALLAFECAELAGGNGFIAAFAAGLTLGTTAPKISDCLYEFAETEGQLLGLAAFLLFGAAHVGPGIEEAGPATFAYAVLSLTLIRMVPVSLSLIGTGMRLPTHLFLGWFGPRGLASILYALMAAGVAEIGAREQIVAIAMVTVMLSVFAHGMSAGPGAAKYGTICERRPGGAEDHPAAEVRVGSPFRARAVG